MRKYTMLLSLLFTISSLVAQKQINDPNAEMRKVNSFHAINVQTGIQLLISQGSTEAVAVSASDDRFRDHIRTEVADGELKIYYDHNFLRELRGNKKLKAYVSFTSLDRLNVSSGASVKVDGEIHVPNLFLKASSGGTFNGKVNVTGFAVKQSSGSIVTVSGHSGSLNIDGNSGSIFHGFDLSSDSCDADATSGSVAHVMVNKTLSARAGSGGSIRYKGEGVISDIKTGSGGSVSRQ